ncbi:MAG: hypothetical protein QW292_05655 [Candidatus Parvarchaeota archaeon]
MSMESDVLRILKIIVDTITRVRKEDRILLIVDNSTEFLVNELGNILYGNETKVLQLSQELNLSDEIIKDRDVIFVFTKENLCFSKNIVKAVKIGKKVLCCAKCTPSKLVRSIPENLGYYHDLTKKLVSAFMPNSYFELISRQGHKLTGQIDKFPPKYVGFLIDSEHNFSILPGGIIGVPIIPRTVNGEILINGFVERIGQISIPLLLKIKEGNVKVVNSSDSPISFLETVSSPWFKPCELGIGTNPNSKTSEDTHESESELGAVDIGFGENKHIGGPIGGSSHFDVTTKGATLYIDTKLIVKEGEIRV